MNKKIFYTMTLADFETLRKTPVNNILAGRTYAFPANFAAAKAYVESVYKCRATEPFVLRLIAATADKYNMQPRDVA